jgi:hypothetical protein
MAYHDPIPEDLLAAISEKRCIALVGSGITSRCLSKTRQPLPGWAGLLRGLTEWAAEEGALDAEDVRDLMQLISLSDFLIVAQELREQLGDAAIATFVAETFDPDALIPSRVHELLSVVPFRGYVTTNYDNLLERAHMNVRKRQLERILPDPQISLEGITRRDPFLLKLHGDLEKPASIVLGYRDYLNLIADPRFQGFLDSIFSQFSLLMVGYGLNDLDIVQSLDRTTHAGTGRRHFLLSRRGSRNAVARRRLLGDRNIQTVEYVDYFGFHNHVDTFLEGVIEALKLGSERERVRPHLRRRIHVHYPERCSADGLFVWNYVFREGAITLSEAAQPSQMEHLKEMLDGEMRALDYVVFVVDREAFSDEAFCTLIERTIEKSEPVGVQVLFFAVGCHDRPDRFIPSAAGTPVFYLREGFGECDLEPFRTYIAQDMKAGFRQP